MRRKILVSWVVMMVLLMSWIPCRTYAQEVPDLNRDGTITITMQYENQPILNGSLKLIRIGDIEENDGNYGYAWTESFRDCGVSIEEIQLASAAKDLEVYAAKHASGGLVVRIQNGSVTFKGVNAGLYLVVQEKAATGYNPISPFVIGLPVYEDEQYRYEVDATPKVEIEKEIKPDKPVNPGPKLPQTSMLWWPVPILVAGGLVFYLFGWYLKRKAD